MTIDQVEAVLHLANIKIALRHRFAFDTGTILRLENLVIINLFDDGRYYVQGSNSAGILAALSDIEAPWDPEKWDGEMPRQAAAAPVPVPVPTKRLNNM